MFLLAKSGLIALSLGAAALLGGCQSGGMATPASHEMAANAVQCDKCQMTWVTKPNQAGGGQGRYSGYTGYTTRKEMVCPDCKDALSNFVATGNLRHECKACGGNMAICDAH